MRCRCATILCLLLLSMLLPMRVRAQPPPLNRIASLTLSPYAVSAGATSIGTVTLLPGTPAAVNVALTSSNPNLATVPAYVTVPINQSSASFLVCTNTVTGAAASVTLTASLGPGSRSSILTVNSAEPQTFYTTANAYVQPASTQNFGSSDPILIQYASGSASRYVGYFKFDLTSLTVAPSQAILRLFQTSTVSSSASELTTLFYQVSNSNWTESAINGANAPALNADGTHNGPASDLLGSSVVTVPQSTGGLTSVALDITGFVRQNLGAVVTLQVLTNSLPDLTPLQIAGRGTRANTQTSGKAFIIASFPNPAADVPLPAWADSMVARDTVVGGDFGPSSSGAVNLASGAYENRPGPDFAVRNPTGPTAVYSRLYRTTQAALGYGSPGLTAGWTDNFDFKITGAAAGGPLTLTYPNGATESLTGAPTGDPSTVPLTPPNGAPYLAQGTYAGGKWTSVTLQLKDESTLTFAANSNTPANTDTLWVAQIANIVHNTTASAGYITLSRDNLSRPTSVVSSANVTLLSFNYGTANKTILTDAYGRKVVMNFGSVVNSLPSLLNVSLIGDATQQADPPMHWQYGYTGYSNLPFISSVSAPDPAGSGNGVTEQVLLTPALYVPQVQDAEGRVTSYSYLGGTTISILPVDAQTPGQTWTQLFTGSGAQGMLDAGVQDANLQQTTLTYDPTNTYQPAVATNPLGQQIALSYETPPNAQPCANLKTVVEPTSTQNVTLTTTYDYTDYALFALGRLQSVTVGSKAPVTLDYYEAGSGGIVGLVHDVYTPVPGTQGDTAQSVTTTYTYTALGNIATMTRPAPNNAGGTVQYKFSYTDGGKSEALGEPTSITDPDSDVTHFQYDGLGNVTAVIDANGYETDTSYNLADQVVSVVYPATTANAALRAYTLYNYAYLGGPLLSTTLYSEKLAPYDTSGVVFRSVGRAPGGEDETKGITGNTTSTQSIYDNLYRPHQFGYYQQGAYPSATAQISQFGYDAVGNPSGIRYPLASGSFDALQGSFDNAYNLTGLLDGRGLTTTFGIANLPTQDSSVMGKTYSDNSPGVSYAYDEYGRLTLEQNGVATRQFTYDDLDNVTQQTVVFAALPTQASSTSYTYNTDGARQSLTVTVGGLGYTTNFTYDSADRLTTIQYPWGDTQTSLYYPNGWLKRHQNTLTKTTYTYNQRGWLASVSNAYLSDLTQLSNFNTITYDAAGNRLQTRVVVSSIPTNNGAGHAAGYGDNANHTYVYYSYDALDHLSGENNTCTTQSGGGNNTFPSLPYNTTYLSDGADNLTTVRGGSAPPNADNQVNLGGFVYDGDGNPTTYNGSSLTWDIEDRLTSTPAYTCGYYDEGLRAWKRNTQLGAVTYFLYDGDHLVAELNSDGSIKNLFGWSTAGLLERWQANNRIFYAYTFDPQGNVVMRHNSHPSADCDYTTLYDAFGAQIGCLDPLTQTQSQQQDMVGFGGQVGYYTDQESWTNPTTPAVRYLWTRCGLRDYDSNLARFLTRDPSGYEGGVNLYAFCRDNPITHFDPTGTDVQGVLNLFEEEGKYLLQAVETLATNPVVQQDTAAVYNLAGAAASVTPEVAIARATVGLALLGNQAGNAMGRYFFGTQTYPTLPASQRLYLTYVIVNMGEIVYVGKTSGVGTIQAVMKARLRRHDHWHPEIGDRAFIIDAQQSEDANAGAEQVFYDYFVSRGAEVRNRTSPLDWKTIGQKRAESNRKVNAFFNEMKNSAFK